MRHVHARALRCAEGANVALVREAAVVEQRTVEIDGDELVAGDLGTTGTRAHRGSA